MKKIFQYAFLLALILILQSCATLADARKAEGEGVRKVYKVSIDKSWNATLKVLSKLKLDLVTENKMEGYILAQRGITAFSYGENIAIFLKTKNDQETEVEVVSKRAMETNIFAPDWSKDIHEELQRALTN
jgi:hypothetical protein